LEKIGLQLAAYVATNILVLYAQALEMLSDVLVSTFLLVSLRWSQKPADKFHMFGHRRSQNVASLVSATIFISFMSLEVFREAIPKFFESPKTGHAQNASIALIVIAASMLVLAVPIADIARVKGRGASVKAQLIQLVKDELSYIPSVIGIVLVAQGYFLADALTSVVIDVIILSGGLYLFKDNVHYLIGRAPDIEFMKAVESTARSVEGVLDVHDLRAEYVGPNLVHAGLHIDVARRTPIEEADRIAHEVEERISRKTRCQHCVVHVHPAEDQSILS